MNFSECSVSELDIFTEEKLQTSILNRAEVAHFPINSLDNASSIEFFSSGQTSSYRDLSNVMLKLKVQILKEGNVPFNSTDKDAAIATADKTNLQPGIVSNSLHSLFKTVQVIINNKTVSNHDNYAYKAYLELLSNYSKKAMQTSHYSAGTILDDKGSMDTTNEGFLNRQDNTTDGKIWTLYGRISLDLSNQPKLLINNLDLRINFILASPDFFLMSTKRTASLKIQEATLYITHCTINPSVMLHHNQLLAKRNIKYPFMKTVLKHITIPSGLESIMLENVFTGLLPTFLMIGLVENQSFSGNVTKNPFKFEKFNLKSLQLIKNNDAVPQEPLDFSDKARPYTYFLNSIDAFNTHKSVVITPDMYENGFFFNAFNLSPLSQIEDCYNINLDGNLRMHLQFDGSLKKTITVLIYAMLPDVLEVDRNFNVATRIP